MVDGFDVEVRNANLDRTCLVDELSSGQFVLVNEAVNLGIAIYSMRQGEGIRYETLFRDETVGALDAVNGKEYDGKPRVSPPQRSTGRSLPLSSKGMTPSGHRVQCRLSSGG
jgi:hypothetical protein